ncbi:type IV toxin-antitoxin system AbiEi family antitoxin domain-containing protein [Micromonospora sp. BRA006-A]|nr:type IV toxin-antitoxin system AbiEi family antitoxin domain-containing protein [Micromonospora sp. BRA006-A]
MIRQIASDQGGVVTRAQALRAGYSRHEIDNLLTSRRWRRLARATYAVERTGPDGVERRRQIRAAVLSLGPEAHAVLGTAAELHGIAGLPRAGAIHVAVPGRAARPSRVRDPAVTLHQFEHPEPALTTVDGIPVTAPRTRSRTSSSGCVATSRWPCSTRRSTRRGSPRRSSVPSPP